MSIEQLASVLAKAHCVLVFTGAGISTGSGIPDYRGPKGLWKQRRPVYYDEFMSSAEARSRFWEYELEGWPGFRDARPNAAHQALADLDRLGRLDTLVTQNIDGLHHRAGHPEGRIVEIHGTNRLMECPRCKKGSPPEPVLEEFARTRQPPRCACGGWWKPATVFFGQMMPQDQMAAALAAAIRCDLAMAIGSSLEVEPAASIPRTAKGRGAYYVIINRGETAQDHLADMRIDDDILSVLPAVVRCVTELLASATS